MPWLKGLVRFGQTTRASQRAFDPVMADPSSALAARRVDKPAAL